MTYIRRTGAGPPFFKEVFVGIKKLRLPHPLWFSKGGSLDSELLEILTFKDPLSES